MCERGDGNSSSRKWSKWYQEYMLESPVGIQSINKEDSDNGKVELSGDQYVTTTLGLDPEDILHGE